MFAKKQLGEEKEKVRKAHLTFICQLFKDMLSFMLAKPGHEKEGKYLNDYLDAMDRHDLWAFSFDVSHMLSDEQVGFHLSYGILFLVNSTIITFDCNTNFKTVGTSARFVLQMLQKVRLKISRGR